MKIVGVPTAGRTMPTPRRTALFLLGFPSNQLETGLWLESERMLHPVINEMGVKLRTEVVKEEKRLWVDNQPMVISSLKL